MSYMQDSLLSIMAVLGLTGTALGEGRENEDRRCKSQEGKLG